MLSKCGGAKREKKKIYTLIRVMLIERGSQKFKGKKKKKKKFEANLRYMGEECCVHISTLKQPEEKRSVLLLLLIALAIILYIPSQSRGS